MIPIMARIMMAKTGPTWGNKSAKGAGKINESNIICLLPNRSAKGPPRKVPIAPVNKKVKM